MKNILKEIKNKFKEVEYEDPLDLKNIVHFIDRILKINDINDLNISCFVSNIVMNRLILECREKKDLFTAEMDGRIGFFNLTVQSKKNGNIYRFISNDYCVSDKYIYIILEPNNERHEITPIKIPDIKISSTKKGTLPSKIIDGKIYILYPIRIKYTLTD